MFLLASSSAGSRMAVGNALLVLAMVLSPLATCAQDIVDMTDSTVAVQAVIRGPDDVLIGRTIILDGSRSTALGTDTQFAWYVNGATEPISRRIDAIFTPEREGELQFRLVVRTTVNGEIRESEAVQTVAAYRRKIILIAHPPLTVERAQSSQEIAAQAGMYLRILQAPSGSPTEDALMAVLRERGQTLIDAESIVLWTDGVVGLQTLMKAADLEPEHFQRAGRQTLLVITNRGVNTIARTARGPYSALRPARIVIAHPEALATFLSSESPEAFLQKAEERDLELAIIDAESTRLRPWNLLSLLVNYMFVQGVPSQTIILLLMLPIIATILSFLKQVIGMTTFGLFAPSIVALSFLAIGWWVGLLFLLAIVFTGYVTRSLMRRWHMLYIPKMAIILTVGSITLLLLLGIGASFRILLPRDSVFILLIMSTLSESFLTAKTEQGWTSAVMAIGQTALAALICVFVVQWPYLQSLILAYPELILLTIVINVLLGRWTGLRLMEYYRFRDVFKHIAAEGRT